MKIPRFTLLFIIFLAITSILIQLPLFKGLHFKEGLDLEGGTSITFKADMSKTPPDKRDQALSSAKEIIERTRVNFSGVSEPIVETAKTNNDYRIIVQLPGVADLNEAVNRVGKTAQLEFREVATDSATFSFSQTKLTGLYGNDLEGAQPTFDTTTGGPIVSFKVKPVSQDKFASVTQRLIGKRMAIYLDKQLISAPTVQSSIRDSGQITGKFTQKETKDLSDFLNGGALPVPLSILSSQKIPPSLGQESLKKSFFAGLIGFLIVVFFMVLNYKKLGFIASIALTLYVLFVLSIFKLSSLSSVYGITLTLSGIAGFILSIGMAVDANILIFERMREEERAGKPNEIAINLGFSRAFPSIRDSNVSTIITSIVLYYFGTGPVKGFALVLAIGVLVSMFSAIVVTRNLIKIFYR